MLTLKMSPANVRPENVATVVTSSLAMFSVRQTPNPGNTSAAAQNVAPIPSVVLCTVSVPVSLQHVASTTSNLVHGSRLTTALTMKPVSFTTVCLDVIRVPKAVRLGCATNQSVQLVNAAMTRTIGGPLRIVAQTRRSPISANVLVRVAVCLAVENNTGTAREAQLSVVMATCGGKTGKKNRLALTVNSASMMTNLPGARLVSLDALLGAVLPAPTEHAAISLLVSTFLKPIRALPGQRTVAMATASEQMLSIAQWTNIAPDQTVNALVSPARVVGLSTSHVLTGNSVPPMSSEPSATKLLAGVEPVATLRRVSSRQPQGSAGAELNMVVVARNWEQLDDNE